MQHQESTHKQPIVFKPEHGEVEFQVILDGELYDLSVSAKFAQTTEDSKTYQVNHFNQELR